MSVLLRYRNVQPQDKKQIDTKKTDKNSLLNLYHRVRQCSVRPDLFWSLSSNALATNQPPMPKLRKSLDCSHVLYNCTSEWKTEQQCDSDMCVSVFNYNFGRLKGIFEMMNICDLLQPMYPAVSVSIGGNKATCLMMVKVPLEVFETLKPSKTGIVNKNKQSWSELIETLIQRKPNTATEEKRYNTSINAYKHIIRECFSDCCYILVNMLQLINHSQMVITLTKDNIYDFRKLTHYAWGFSMWSMKSSIGISNLRECVLPVSDMLHRIPLPTFNTLELV